MRSALPAVVVTVSVAGSGNSGMERGLGAHSPHACRAALLWGPVTDSIVGRRRAEERGGGRAAAAREPLQEGDWQRTERRSKGRPRGSGGGAIKETVATGQHFGTMLRTKWTLLVDCFISCCPLDKVSVIRSHDILPISSHLILFAISLFQMRGTATDVKSFWRCGPLYLQQHQSWGRQWLAAVKRVEQPAHHWCHQQLGPTLQPQLWCLQQMGSPLCSCQPS